MTSPLPLPDLEQPSARPRPYVLLNNQIELYGAVALLIFAPLAFGAYELWARFVLELVSATLFCSWSIRQIYSGSVAVRWNPIFAPMCAFAGLGVIQLLSGASAYRHATASTLATYISYGLVCFLLAQALERTTQVRQLSTLFVVYGASIAMFAVLQSMTSNGKLYWLRTPRFGGWIYGPYVNHNHYAGLMEMLTPIPMVYAFSRYAHGRKKWLAAGTAAFMGASIFLSGSRGGMAAFGVQIALFFWLLFRERTRSSVALLMAGFLLMALASITWIGGNDVSARISTLADYKRPEVNADFRLKIARDTLHMIAARPVMGWGLGTFADVYPEFRSFYTDSLVNAAHNDYLQTLAETGLLGFGIAIWLLFTAIHSAVRKLHNWPSDINGIVSLAALLGVCGILVHSFVDFNLEIPANALLFYVLCSIAALDARFRNLRRKSRANEVTEPLADVQECTPVV